MQAQPQPSIPLRDRCLRPKEAAEKLAIGVSTLWKYAKTDPHFPSPIRMSSKCTVFRESELDEYVQRKAAQSKAAA
jgi:prophage regulatory protein